MAYKIRKCVPTDIDSHDGRQLLPSPLCFGCRVWRWAQDFKENTAAALFAEVVLDIVICEAIGSHGVFGAIAKIEVVLDWVYK